LALASADVPLGPAPLRAARLARVGAAAADCVSRAIARAVHHAR
jgi:L-aminopeptidase/D-esterase-like protein